MIIRELINKIGFKVDKHSMAKAEKKTKLMSGRMKAGLLLAAGAVLAIGTAAVKAAADMEVLETQFEVMLGSADAAKNMMGELREFSIETPFETEDLAKSATTLLQFGVEADNIMPTIKMLGDVAGTNKQRFQSLAVVFGQIKSTGRLMGQDLLQLINQGFNPLQVISQKTGKSVAQLKDEMSKGKISADMVTEAFKIATSEGGMFFENMKKQSMTLTGLFSTMRGAFKEVLLDIGVALLPLIKEVTKLLTNLAKGALGDLIKMIVQSFVPLLEEVSKIIEPIFAALVPVWEALGPVIHSLIKIFMSVFMPLLKSLMPVFKILARLIKIVGKILEKLAPLFVVVGEVFSMLADVAVMLLEAFMPLMEAIGDLAGALAEALLPILKIFADLLRISIMLLEPLMPVMDDLVRSLVMIIKLLVWALKVVQWVAEGLAFVINKLASFVSWALGKDKKFKTEKPKPLTVKIKTPSMAAAMQKGMKGGNRANVNMTNNIGVSGDVSDRRAAENNMREAARSIFTIELQKILVNAEY
jgi:tape measure domain-containing protein